MVKIDSEIIPTPFVYAPALKWNAAEILHVYCTLAVLRYCKSSNRLEIWIEKNMVELQSHVGKSPVVASPDPHDVTIIAVNITAIIITSCGSGDGTRASAFAFVSK